MEIIYKYSRNNSDKADFYLVGSSVRGEDSFNDYDVVIHPKQKDINMWSELLNNCPKKETDGKMIDCNLIEDIESYLSKKKSKTTRYNIRNGKFNIEFFEINSPKHLTKGLDSVSTIYYRKIT